MSILRLTGLAIGLIAIGISFFRLRSHLDRRTDTWLLLPFGTVIILVSLFPGLVNLPADLLSLGDRKGGRLITLLLISSAFLWFFTIHERGKNESRYLKLDEWIRNTTVKEFFENNRQDIFQGAIAVLIPAFNEARNLEKVLSQVPENILGKTVKVLVIDDGSTDDTARIAREHGAEVALQRINRGGGAALKVGYDIIMKTGGAVIVTMDADGQHNPDQIEILVKPILKNESDFIIGSRMLGSFEQYSKLRVSGVIVFSKMINMLIGTNITDCSSGFRAFNKSVLEQCILMQEQYHTAELIFEAAKRGFRIDERPITIERRLSGTSKKGKEFRYALNFLRTIVKTWFR